VFRDLANDHGFASCYRVLTDASLLFLTPRLEMARGFTERDRSLFLSYAVQIVMSPAIVLFLRG
jgi:hypothetical protein